MPRPPRFTYARAVHHVTLRRSNREFLVAAPWFGRFGELLQEARFGVESGERGVRHIRLGRGVVASGPLRGRRREPLRHTVVRRVTATCYAFLKCLAPLLPLS